MLPFNKLCPLGLAVATLSPATSPGQDTAPSPAAPGPGKATPEVVQPPQPVDLADAKRLVVKSYAEIAEAAYADALARAIELRKDIKAFVAAPDVPNHIAAKLSWLEARMPYLQTEALRFAGGPIDSIEGLERAINGWPIDAASIDVVGADGASGVVNDVEALPKITPETVAALNGEGAGGATGFHVIEFLLWGEDNDPESGGKRTHADYIATGEGGVGRRGAYLVACADLLVRNLSDLLAEWRSGKPDNYRASFEKMPVDQALAKIFSGAATVAQAEFAARRLGAPYEKRDGEAEQSRFSDTTHVDALHNTAGLANLVAGAYVGLDGKVRVLGVGMAGLADEVSEERGKTLRAAPNAAIGAARKIGAPFDQEVLGEDTAPGRVEIKALIDALATLSAEISGLAAELEIPMPE